MIIEEGVDRLEALCGGGAGDRVGAEHPPRGREADGERERERGECGEMTFSVEASGHSINRSMYSVL